MEELPNELEAAAVICPHCDQAVDVSAIESGAAVQCPHCQGEFVRPVDVADETDRADREAELSNLRIRQISALRRGAYRSRSYCIVGVVALTVAAVKLIIMTVHQVQFAGWQTRPVGYLLGAAAALMGAGFFAARAMELTREVAKPLLVDPPGPPDFSTLSDGSQQVKHLEEM
jgi:hypothetical protein